MRKILVFIFAIVSMCGFSSCSNKEIIDGQFTCSIGNWSTVSQKDTLTTSLTFNTSTLEYERFSGITILLLGENNRVMARAVSSGQKIIALLEYYEENWPLLVGNLTIICAFTSSMEYTVNDMWEVSPFDSNSTSEKQPQTIKVAIETADNIYTAQYTVQ